MGLRYPIDGDDSGRVSNLTWVSLGKTVFLKTSLGAAGTVLFGFWIGGWSVEFVGSQVGLGILGKRDQTLQPQVS